MESMSRDEKQSAKVLGKTLAIAAMAASLGVSLGVRVDDVLAADGKLNSPPAISQQDKQNVSSKQLKLSNQSKLSGQSKVSNQYKFSNQSKQSNHGKPESSQIKIDSRKASEGSNTSR